MNLSTSGPTRVCSSSCMSLRVSTSQVGHIWSLCLLPRLPLWPQSLVSTLRAIWLRLTRSYFPRYHSRHRGPNRPQWCRCTDCPNLDLSANVLYILDQMSCLVGECSRSARYTQEESGWRCSHLGPDDYCYSTSDLHTMLIIDHHLLVPAHRYMARVEGIWCPVSRLCRLVQADHLAKGGAGTEGGHDGRSGGDRSYPQRILDKSIGRLRPKQACCRDRGLVFLHT